MSSRFKEEEKKKKNLIGLWFWYPCHTTLLLALPAVEIRQFLKLHVDCADMKG